MQLSQSAHKHAYITAGGKIILHANLFGDVLIEVQNSRSAGQMKMKTKLPCFDWVGRGETTTEWESRELRSDEWARLQIKSCKCKVLFMQIMMIFFQFHLCLTSCTYITIIFYELIAFWGQCVEQSESQNINKTPIYDRVSYCLALPISLLSRTKNWFFLMKHFQRNQVNAYISSSKSSAYVIV